MRIRGQRFRSLNRKESMVRRQASWIDNQNMSLVSLNKEAAFSRIAQIFIQNSTGVGYRRQRRAC